MSLCIASVLRFRIAVPLLLLATSLAAVAQRQNISRPIQPADDGRPYRGYQPLRNDFRANVGPYPGAPQSSPFAAPETNFDALHDAVRQVSQPSATYLDLVERQRILRASEGAKSNSENGWYVEREEAGIQSHADPDAPDQSELLKNSHDRDFILHNFRTMYVDTRDAQFFNNNDMKAAFHRNKGFEKLGISIVDDPSVADTVLKVSYTFAWDYPFELRHQNTTIVLLAGKGEGPLYGPLGAADVARQFVKVARQWREEKKAGHKE